MKEFFDTLSLLEQTYWIVALISSSIFLIIFILTFIGGGDADMEINMDDVSGDDGGVGFQFFTFKNVISFFTIFGWTGIICLNNNIGAGLTIVLSSLAGLVMMVITSALFYMMGKMVQSGTINMRNAIGMVGEVYLPIGAKRSKKGKIQVKVQGSLREFDAITDEPKEISTSTMIQVIDVLGEEILLVKKTTP